MLREISWQEEGFTLAELLIILAILCILAGVATLALQGVAGQALSVTIDAERRVVQAAIETYMAHNELDEIEERVDPAIIQSDNEDAPFTAYLRRLPTKYRYAWTSDGFITLQIP